MIPLWTGRHDLPPLGKREDGRIAEGRLQTRGNPNSLTVYLPISKTPKSLNRPAIFSTASATLISSVRITITGFSGGS